ncbi:MAG: diaminopimelate epimerase [Acidobacteriia bacterium]|nr:diaminopimelate epimerase [Terriglobia bacterium]
MIPFYKAHGLGNDFLIVDREALPDASEESLALLAQQGCDRHRGIGADGVVYIFPGMDYPQYDFSIRLFNSDGSEAEMSGNGIRCAAAVHHWKNPEASREVVLGSVVGRRVLRLIDRQGAKFTYVAEMGVPGFNPEDIPFAVEGMGRKVRPSPGNPRLVGVPLDVEDRTFEITVMSVGNPQCITLVEEFESFDWKRYGRALESHPRFPKKTNVEFVRVIDEHTVEIRIWERGAGHTESSGTGSIASALGALLNGRATSPVRVITEGGVLQVEWKGEGEPVFLTGDAEIVCEGIFLGAKGI